MIADYDATLKSALSLPEIERAQLVDALIASFDAPRAIPLDDAWLAEIDRRSAAFDAGEITPLTWSEVRERAQRRVARRG